MARLAFSPGFNQSQKKILHLQVTIQAATQQLLFQLYHLYEEREAAAIADLVMEHITEWQKIDRIINKHIPLPLPGIALLKKYTDELLTHKPVQYVLNEAWFSGMKLYVDENVLIPRPETEELVEWVVEEIQSAKYEVQNGDTENFVSRTSHFAHILDVGTGSGCIPIALKKKFPGVSVFSCDLSEEALAIARRNAESNDTDIHFLHLDFLNAAHRKRLPSFDLIVSNPPYIPLQDKETMPPNVVGFEPHLALFVNDKHPMVFYEAIADFAKEKLTVGGKVFVEIHEELSSHVKELFSFKGFSGIEIKNDMQGKARMLKAGTI